VQAATIWGTGNHEIQSHDYLYPAAMVLGIVAGGLIHSQFSDPATHKLFAGYIRSQHHLPAPDQDDHRPLVFSTWLSASAIWRMPARSAGRRQGHAMVRHRVTGLAVLGLILVDLFAPGEGSTRSPAE